MQLFKISTPDKLSPFLLLRAKSPEKREGREKKSACFLGRGEPINNHVLVHLMDDILMEIGFCWAEETWGVGVGWLRLPSAASFTGQ